MNLKRILSSAVLIAVSSTATAQVNYDVQLVAIVGDVIDGRTVDSISAVRLNENGEIAFSGHHDSDPNTWRGNLGTIWSTSEVLLMEGDVVDGVAIPSFNYSSFEFNNNGDAAVAGVFGEPARAAIYTATEAIGLPGSVIDGVVLGGGVESGFAFSDDGTVTFMSDIETGTPGVTVPAILTQNGVLLTQGDTVGGVVADDIDTNGVYGRLHVDGNGTPYFVNGDNSATIESIMSTNGIVLSEDPNYDGVGIDYINTSTSALGVNASGDVIFAGEVDGVAGLHSSYGPLLLQGDTIGSNTVDSAYLCAWNDAGEVATLANMNGYSDFGVVTQDSVLMKEGDTIAGLTLAYFNYSVSINNSGAIAFTATLTDGSDYYGAVLLATPVMPCDGDTDGDNDIDLSDLAQLLSDFGRTGSALAGDVDADGDVDLTDLAIVLGRFGASC